MMAILAGVVLLLVLVGGVLVVPGLLNKETTTATAIAAISTADLTLTSTAMTLPTDTPTTRLNPTPLSTKINPGDAAATVMAANATETMAARPTNTATLTPNDTQTIAAIVGMTYAAQTAVVASSYTKTPTLTHTPTLTATGTPTPTFAPTLTATGTPTPTFSPTVMPSLTPSNTVTATLPPTAASYPTASTNQAWTPITRTFEDGVVMVLVPKGCFNMGSTKTQAQAAVDQFVKDGNAKSDAQAFVSSEQPMNRVCFDHPFWIDKTDVTQEQFKRLGGTAANSPSFTGDNRPVESITWFESRDFCEKKRGARLLTEAEWEYAARGPDSWIFPWGNSFDAANAVYYENSENQAANVGSKSGGDSWVGASDMAGNLWQWTSTIYDRSKFPYPYMKGDGREIGNNTTSSRVRRGGAFYDGVSVLRSAGRMYDPPGSLSNKVGFRCARP
jgi:iron(II)-dependent oxidoreductase